MATKRISKPSDVYPAWTDAKFWSFVRSGLRAKWVRWPPRYEALRASRKEVKGKRHRFEHKCAQCKEWKQQKYVQVDHIVPCGTLRSYEDLASFVKKLFVPSSKLRILCKACHNDVTQKAKNENSY